MKIVLTCALKASLDLLSTILAIKLDRTYILRGSFFKLFAFKRRITLQELYNHKRGRAPSRETGYHWLDRNVNITKSRPEFLLATVSISIRVSSYYISVTPNNSGVCVCVCISGVTSRRTVLRTVSATPSFHLFSIHRAW